MRLMDDASPESSKLTLVGASVSSKLSWVYSTARVALRVVVCTSSPPVKGRGFSFTIIHNMTVKTTGARFNAVSLSNHLSIPVPLSDPEVGLPFRRFQLLIQPRQQFLLRKSPFQLPLDGQGDGSRLLGDDHGNAVGDFAHADSGTVTGSQLFEIGR